MRFPIEYQDPERSETRAQSLLLPWLSRDDADALDLVRWLEGSGLPPLGDSEPFEFLLKGLPRRFHRGEATDVLAGRLARLFATRMDEPRPGRFPDRVLYNALMLAAALARPTMLCEPLDAIRHRGVLHGDWQGAPLRAALVAAMVHNQKDDRWRVDWEALVDDRSPFPVTPYDGFSGVLWMADEKGNRPVVSAIGTALAKMAKYLTEWHAREQRPRFLALLERVRQTYPSPHWPLRMVQMADKNRWPDWAVDCLPLFVRVRQSESEPADDDHDPIYLVHSAIYPGLRVLPSVSIVDRFCGDRLFTVRAEDVTPVIGVVRQLEQECLEATHVRPSELWTRVQARAYDVVLAARTKDNLEYRAANAVASALRPMNRRLTGDRRVGVEAS